MDYELKVPSCPTLLLFGSEYSNEQWHYVSLILSVLVMYGRTYRRRRDARRAAERAAKAGATVSG
jgi:hypothetical protein